MGSDLPCFMAGGRLLGIWFLTCPLAALEDGVPFHVQTLPPSSLADLNRSLWVTISDPILKFEPHCPRWLSRPLYLPQRS